MTDDRPFADAINFTREEADSMLKTPLTDSQWCAVLDRFDDTIRDWIESIQRHDNQA
jgi:hypothetical protein